MKWTIFAGDDWQRDIISEEDAAFGGNARLNGTFDTRLEALEAAESNLRYEKTKIMESVARLAAARRREEAKAAR